MIQLQRGENFQHKFTRHTACSAHIGFLRGRKINKRLHGDL